jgi:hypothetical protein
MSPIDCVSMSGALTPRLVRPVAVIVARVLAEYQSQVAFAADQDPIQELMAESSDDMFADGVNPRGQQTHDEPNAIRLHECIQHWSIILFSARFRVFIFGGRAPSVFGPP